MVVSLGLLLSGCGGAPGEIGPSGVDELTIPTPSPDPADFVEGVDNRWFPLPEGARWEYRIDHDVTASPRAVVDYSVRVEGATRVIQGVTCTEVQMVGRSARGEVVVTRSTWYTQDRAGNVWLMGELMQYPGTATPDWEWQAGQLGAEAGVVMPAQPRLGDGFWMMRQPPVREQQARVTEVGAELATPEGRVGGGVLLSVDQNGTQSTQSFAPGLGFVSLEADSTHISLVSTSLSPS